MAHSHNHGGGHSHDDANPDDDWNLYQHLERAEVLNAVVLGEGDTTWAPNATGKALCIMRPNARRLQQGQILSSDSDEQVIVKLQFAAPVSVRKLMAHPQPKTRHPGSGTVGHPRLKARLACVGLQSRATAASAPPCRPGASPRRRPRRPVPLLPRCRHLPPPALAMQVIGAGPAAHHPSSVHCYVGQAAEDLDFSGLDGVVPAQVAIR